MGLQRPFRQTEISRPADGFFVCDLDDRGRRRMGQRGRLWCENDVFVRYPNADINPAPTQQSEINGVVSNCESLYCYAGPWPELVCLKGNATPLYEGATDTLVVAAP